MKHLFLFLVISACFPLHSIHRGFFRLGQIAATQTKKPSCLKVLKEKLLEERRKKIKKTEQWYLETVQNINQSTSKHQETMLYNARSKKEKTVQQINAYHDEAMAKLLENSGQKAALNSCSGC